MENKIHTFGCRLNTFESEIIRKNIEDIEDDNIVIFNTCAVTKEAERQAKQAIRKTKRNNPEAKIIVTGCSAQIAPKQYENMPEVYKILGNQEKLHKKYYKESYDSNVYVSDIMQVKENTPHLVHSFDGRVRAFVEVQNGCNHRCTFCIIPFGRGNNRSTPAGIIVNQIKNLVATGYKEVVITGVDISDYGKDLPGTPTLGMLLKRILKMVPHLPRIRLSSIDVAEIDNDIWDLIKNEKRFMPYLHLSVQSGDDMILKRMKRRHNRQQIIDFCNKARVFRPHMAFGADIIAGFPTESDEMFKNTLDLIKDANLQYLHIFPYSPRENTPAAKMPQIPANIRKERAKLLRKEGKKQLKNFLQNKVGLTEEVIVEKNNMARCEDFSTVKISKKFTIGSLIKVKIKNFEDCNLIA